MRLSFRILKDLLLTVATPLILGVMIYYFTRSHSIFFLSWFDHLINLKAFPALKLPAWVMFHLPDGLWTFAFSSMMLIIWKHHIDRESIGWVLFPLAIGVILELIIGTFDVQDLWFILAGGLIPLIAHPYNKYSITQKNRNNEENQTCY